MNRNKIRTTIAALSATLLLTGCGAERTYEDWDVPTFGGWSTETTIPVTETIPITESTQHQFDFGQEVWCVEGNSDACLVRYAIVGQHGDLVEVVPYFTSDVQQLRESMGCPYLIEMDQVYLDRYDAMVAVAEANGETFEEYWGEYNE